MGKYNPQIHDRQSIRLPNYDYTTNGAYFVTLCTKYRECLFGEIVDGTMRINHFGSIIKTSWLSLEQKYQYVKLDQFVVMPNHFHGILYIDKTLAKPTTKIKSLGRLIGAFKTNSARKINCICETSEQTIWQRNFYEHIIRNEKALQNIRQYIIDNPLKWHLDTENPLNLPDYQIANLDIPF